MDVPPGMVLLPQSVLNPPQQHSEHGFVQVPPRIRVAIGLLGHLAEKQQARVAVNDISIEIIPYYKLTDQERDAQNCALDALEQYISGTLKESIWDKPLAPPKPTGPALVQLRIQCPGCKGNPIRQAQCEVCGGIGVVSVCRVEDQGE